MNRFRGDTGKQNDDREKKSDAPYAKESTDAHSTPVAAAADSPRDNADDDDKTNGKSQTTVGSEEVVASNDTRTAAVPPFSQPQFPAANQNATQPSPRKAVYILPGLGTRSAASTVLSPLGQGVRILGSPSSDMVPSGTDSSGSGTGAVTTTLLIPVLSALSKVLVASLLTPGGPRRNPILNLLFPGRDKAYLPEAVQKYTFERINDRYERDGAALRRALVEQSATEQRNSGYNYFWRSGRSTSSSNDGRRNRIFTRKAKQVPERTVIVVDFCSDPGSPSAKHLHSPPHHSHSLGAPQDPIELLRDQVSFIMQQYNDPSIRPLFGSEVEIVLLVESGGGGVQDYGLAADAVRRIRQAGSSNSVGGGVIASNTTNTVDVEKEKEAEILLTVCVDRVAASGGYMIASQATPGRLFAAPFALLGSIGVYTEQVNIHDMLSRLGIRGLKLKAGKSKSPIGTIGEISPTDVEGVQEDLERVHDAFRSLVKDSRNGEIGRKSIGKVMEGEVYLGQQAKDLGLIDRTITSDEYISERVRAGDRVLRLQKYDKPKAFGGLGISPLDLLLSDGGPLGRWKNKFRSAISTSNIMDILKAGGMAAGVVVLLAKDFQARDARRLQALDPHTSATKNKNRHY